MRLASVLLILGLAACQMQAGGKAPLQGIEDEVIVGSSLSGGALPTAPAAEAPEVAPPTAATALPTGAGDPAPEGALPTAGSVPDEGTSTPTEAVAAPVSPQQALCEKAGGAWAKVGASGNVCVKRMKDAGKSCRKKADCRGECLAQSGTCAPIAPLMGCNEVLDSEGRQMTQCLQ